MKRRKEQQAEPQTQTQSHRHRDPQEEVLMSLIMWTQSGELTWQVQPDMHFHVRRTRHQGYEIVFRAQSTLYYPTVWITAPDGTIAQHLYRDHSYSCKQLQELIEAQLQPGKERCMLGMVDAFRLAHQVDTQVADQVQGLDAESAA